MSLSLYTGWLVGAINGYRYNEGGLPSSIKYGTMGLVTGASIFKMLAKPSHNTSDPRILLVALVFGAPLVSGSIFCLGHHFGKAVGYSEESESKKNKVSITLI